jgi:hypothetical protein
MTGGCGHRHKRKGECARASRRRGWAALLGRTGASEHDRGRVAAGRSAGPSRRKEGESARVEFCFSFSKK